MVIRAILPSHTVPVLVLVFTASNGPTGADYNKYDLMKQNETSTMNKKINGFGIDFDW